MGRLQDLTGQTFGRLTVVERTENKGKDAAWLCRCQCGKEISVTGHHLKTGHTKSCGCYKTQLIIEQGRKNATHGMKKTRLYKIWSSMKVRCSDPNVENYPAYGGRGINVCEEWRSSFESFRDWAFANGYNNKLTIDRIDVNGNYEPSNCRWATIKEQSNNKRTNRLISYKGKTQTLTQWADEIGFLPSTLSERIRTGWSIEKALTTPVQKRKKRG